MAQKEKGNIKKEIKFNEKNINKTYDNKKENQSNSITHKNLAKFYSFNNLENNIDEKKTVNVNNNREENQLEKNFEKAENNNENINKTEIKNLNINNNEDNGKSINDVDNNSKVDNIIKLIL